MKRQSVRRALLLVSVIMILLVFLLSVYAAFLNTEKAAKFVNSMAIGFLWLLFMLSVLLAMVLLPTVGRRLPMALVHAGVLFIMVGSVWGSETWHDLSEIWQKNQTVRRGEMLVYKGQTSSRVVSSTDGGFARLPFALKLVDFRVVYDDAGELQVRSPGGSILSLAAEIGRTYYLGYNQTSLHVLKSYKNYRILFENQRKLVIDDPGSGSNPALEIRLEGPWLEPKTQVIFPKLPLRPYIDQGLTIEFRQVIRDYLSEIQLKIDGRSAIKQEISSNEPIRFYGYHIYQHAYDQKAHSYSVLLFVSDRGLNWVYLGFVCLCVGLIWHFWRKGLQIGRKAKIDAAHPAI